MHGILDANEKFHKKRVKSNHNLEQLPTIDILDLFPNFQETLSTYSFLEGTSLVTDLMLLKKLAISFDNCAYFEIGTWRGESVINVSEVAGHSTCLTLSASEMKRMGLDDEFIRVHGAFLKGSKNILTIEQNSKTFDFSNLDKKYDLIFVDGDHSYDGVLNDTKKVFNLRKNSSSIIVWHDYGFTTETIRYSVLAAILDGIPQSLHRNLYHVSNTMCAVYMEDMQYETYLTNFPSFPNKKFTVTVRADKL